MSEQNVKQAPQARLVRHTGRASQIRIYLGKQLRFFINENDWKVLPMAAVIAALVGMVIHRQFFINMEGGLIGAFALVCTAIWNGCFNSIQSICRERAIIKREHRSGMHVSSYVAAHMIYQLLLCIAQTGVTIYVLTIVVVKFPDEGFMTPWMMLDIGITMLLISYGADMMSLFLSSISRTTTGAMTLMPFVLIFQLVFSGSVIPLPDWGQGLSNLTISTYGVKAIASQSGYNELPMDLVWTTVEAMRDDQIGGTVTAGEILDLLDSKAVEKRRDTEIVKAITLGDAADLLNTVTEQLGLRDKTDTPITVSPEDRDTVLSDAVTLGEITDFLKENPVIQQQRDRTITLDATMGDLLDLFGEEKAQELIRQKTADASRKPEYDRTVENVVGNWLMLGVFILLFAVLAVISLELIDKDKR